MIHSLLDDKFLFYSMSEIFLFQYKNLHYLNLLGYLDMNVK